MASVPKGRRTYDNIHAEGNSRMHLGDVYNNYQSPDERAVVAILDSLRYPGMSDRRDALAEAHERTFDWTFLEGETKFLREYYEYKGQEWESYDTVDMSFKSWLQQEGQGLFCVMGKPGSGKSTFMKMLAANEEATAILQSWADDATLLRADHFFWILGAPAQKSIEGLLRSILHSILLGLSQCAESETIGAIKHICATRWQSATASGVWSRTELKQMLSRLSSVSAVKSFLLIDALDECEPQDRLNDLATEILWISQLPNVKVCVSCRPWDVFTRRFEHSISLSLDQLTRRDMETYIRSRLTSAEKERSWESDFRNETHAAKQLIQSIARSAEGVFLWTEFVVTAMCIEVRKGRKVEQLTQIISDFPTDLDEYFHRLIFKRIGRSRQNVKDTAAALKLASLVINTPQQREAAPLESHPFEDSYMNFWLLRDGHLKPGFSWTDSERIVHSSVPRMLDQTASYLEEICKDLLVLNRATESVGYLHRTVFDFLSDNKVQDSLEQNAPSHFSSKDFPFDLARLRCLCLLRTESDSYNSLGLVLGRILQIYEHLIHLDEHAKWLSKVESVTISQMGDNSCRSYWKPLLIPNYSRPSYCVKAGLSRTLLEFYRHVPALALQTDGEGIDLLGQILHVANQTEIRKPDLSLLQYVLEMGCNANTTVRAWSVSWDYFPFCIVESPTTDDSQNPKRCVHTAWTAWLSETYVRFAEARSTSGSKKIPSWRKRQAAVMMDLLLRYGADPHCIACVTNHFSRPGEECRLMALDQLMEAILPADRLAMLQDLRQVCSNQAIGNALRRNQRKRAVRSLLMSEQFYERLANDEGASLVLDPLGKSDPYLIGNKLASRVADNMANARRGVCNRCLNRKSLAQTAIWCLECGDQSILCYYCLEQDPSAQPTLGPSCGEFTGHDSTAIVDHWSVTFVGVSHVRDVAVALQIDKPLLLQDPTGAIATMKEWYAKDPIEPDLTFEDVVRSTRAAFPLPLDQKPVSGRITGEASNEGSSKSSRAWSTFKQFVRRH